MADLSGSITAGGAAQSLGLYNPARQGLFIQVPSSEETIWVRFGATAAAVSPSVELNPGESLVMGKEFRELIVRPISIFGVTTGKKFTAFDSFV